MPELLCLGISYKTAPIALRERIALLAPDAETLCRQLVDLPTVHEAVAISTCNRTEVYLVGEAAAAEAALLAAMVERGNLDPSELRGAVFNPRNCDAARHLFSVTSGLESMVVGEAEIQGQVKRAYEAALAAGTTGPMTNRLFSAALRTGRRVRSETLIGAGHASVSSVAVALAEDVVGDLASRKVLIIGAGETSELTARALSERGVRTIFIANRRADRAHAIAERFGGSVSGLHELPEHLTDADIVVTSTSSPDPIIGAAELAEIIGARNGRPLALIDIAVPRDVDAACARLPGVSVYDIDDLNRSAAANLQVREDERRLAEAVIEDEIHRFAGWMGQREVMPTIGELRQYGTTIVEQVLAENAMRWESASPRDLARIDALARSLMQRLLHEPTVRLKGLEPTGSPAHGRVHVVRELFGLADDGSDAPADRELDGPEHEADVRALRPGQ
jgi:glutamyl-tRNA reductase